MSTATSAAPNYRANSAVAGRAQAGSTVNRSAEPSRTLMRGSDEAAVLNIDLGGLQLPKVGGLNVDGFKPTLFQRLFGKR